MEIESHDSDAGEEPPDGPELELGLEGILKEPDESVGEGGVLLPDYRIYSCDEEEFSYIPTELEQDVAQSISPPSSIEDDFPKDEWDDLETAIDEGRDFPPRKDYIRSFELVDGSLQLQLTPTNYSDICSRNIPNY